MGAPFLAFLVVILLVFVKESQTVSSICILDRCPPGFYCRSEDRHCVGLGGKQLEIIGECVNNLCPPTYKCFDKMCVRVPRVPMIKAKPIGPCVVRQCPRQYVCEIHSDLCYPIDIRALKESLDYFKLVDQSKGRA